jgi:hypothetical protein
MPCSIKEHRIRLSACITLHYFAHTHLLTLQRMIAMLLQAVSVGNRLLLAVVVAAAAAVR